MAIADSGGLARPWAIGAGTRVWRVEIVGTRGRDRVGTTRALVATGPSERSLLGRISHASRPRLIVDDGHRRLRRPSVVVMTVLLAVVRGDPYCGGRELAGLELEGGEVETGELPEMDEAEYGLGKEVEYTVEDHLGVGRDQVAAVGETPGCRALARRGWGGRPRHRGGGGRRKGG